MASLAKVSCDKSPVQGKLQWFRKPASWGFDCNLFSQGWVALLSIASLEGALYNLLNEWIKLMKIVWLWNSITLHSLLLAAFCDVKCWYDAANVGLYAAPWHPKSSRWSLNLGTCITVTPSVPLPSHYGEAIGLKVFDGRYSGSREIPLNNVIDHAMSLLLFRSFDARESVMAIGLYFGTTFTSVFFT